MSQDTNIEKPRQIRSNRIVAIVFWVLAIVAAATNETAGLGLFFLWFGVGMFFFAIGQHHYKKWYELVEAQKALNSNG